MNTLGLIFLWDMNIYYKHNNELIINGKIQDDMLKNGTLLIKNDKKINCINEMKN